MNPFEITWLVVTTNTNNTKKVLNKLFRAGIISISGCGTGYIAHYPNKDFVRKGIVQQIPISQKQIEETIQF